MNSFEMKTFKNGILILNLLTISVVVFVCLMVNINDRDKVVKLASVIAKPKSYHEHFLERDETFSDLVGMHEGYESEEHEVITDDGYILKIHRIISQSQKNTTQKPAVLIFHGLSFSSSDLVFRGPGQDLAFLLAESNFDVWLMNFRGNVYSNGHKVWDIKKDGAYWNFSFHELGIYDAPATIDFILKTTGVETLSIVGHSMGTTVAYVLLSMRPEYNEKVNLLIALAPVAIFTHPIGGLFPSLAVRHMFAAHSMLSYFRRQVIFPPARLIFYLYKYLSQLPGMELVFQKFYSFLLQASLTLEIHPTDPTVFAKSLKYRQDVSWQVLLHYLQLQKVGEFRQYDPQFEFLAPKNITKAPLYPLQKVGVPQFVYCAPNDGLSRTEDVNELMKHLPNAQRIELDDKIFSHTDFWFYDGTKELYDNIISKISVYNRVWDVNLVNAKENLNVM